MADTTTIRGIVIPVAWDEKGDATSVAIATYHEEKYLVGDNITGRKLISLSKQRVVVDGVIKDKDSVKIIYAKTIRIDDQGTQDTGRKIDQIKGQKKNEKIHRSLDRPQKSSNCHTTTAGTVI